MEGTGQGFIRDGGGRRSVVRSFLHHCMQTVARGNGAASQGSGPGPKERALDSLLGQVSLRKKKKKKMLLEISGTR